MLNSVDFSGKPFHFIGIGGIGMSALAYILTKRKLPVSGSDLRSSHITQCLQALGAQIFWRQEGTNLNFFCPSEPSPSYAMASATSLEAVRVLAPIDSGLSQSEGLPQVICSTAIYPDNPEYQAALALGCPIFHRSDLLAALMQDYQSVAVAGTHGKTTTSSLLGYILLKAGLDPTIVVGGEVKAWQGNARLGAGPYLIAEADESDGSLVKLSADIGIITNVELDHPDHYGTLDEVIDTFKAFADRCDTLVGSLDCPTIRTKISSARTSHPQPMISYSLRPDSGADYTVDGVAYRADGTTAQVWERNQLLGQLDLKLLGQHNLSNALAALAVGRLLGIDFPAIAGAIASFEGARRRFEHRGHYNGILFVDDYAHHPSEIRATLAAARLQVGSSSASDPHRVVAVFQPHRYSRTLTFLSEFAQGFGDADSVVITDIYSAGEPDLDCVNSQQLVDLIAADHIDVHYRSTLQSVTNFLRTKLRPGDLVIFLGAGNLNQIIPDVMAFYQSAETQGLHEV